jgi:uncharacterized membrane protein YhaH (DUF805 family)
MTPIDWALRPLKRYADFRGRASRAEYWYYSLFATIAGLIVVWVDRSSLTAVYSDLGPLSILFWLMLLVPGIAVTIRRFHDIDRAGWWFLLDMWTYNFVLPPGIRQQLTLSFGNLPNLIKFVAVLGFVACVLVPLIFSVTRGSEGPNRYGPDPYGPDQLEEVFA